MPRKVTFEGKSYTFPDDATDDEISEALGPAPAAAPTSDQNKMPYLGPNWDTVKRGASAAWGVAEPVINFPGRVAQAAAEATGGPQALDAMLSKAKGVPAQPDPMMSVSGEGIPESEPWSAGGVIRESTNMAVNPLAILKVPGLVQKGAQAARAGVQSATSMPAISQGVARGVREGATGGVRQMMSQAAGDAYIGKSGARAAEEAQPYNRWWAQHADDKPGVNPALIEGTEQAMAMKPRPDAATGAHIPKAGEKAPPSTALSPRPSAQPQPLPTSRDIANARTNPTMPAQGVAGIIRRNAEVPPASTQPLPVNTPPAQTPTIEEPAAALLRKIGVPLMGVAAAIAPFLGLDSPAEAGPVEQAAKGAAALSAGTKGLGVAEDVAAGVKAAAQSLKGVPGLEPGFVSKAAKWAQDYYTARPHEWSGPLLPGEQLTDRIVTTILTRPGDPQLQAIMQSAGLTTSEFAPILRQGATDAGKYLRSLQELQMGLRKKQAMGALTPMETELLETVGKAQDAYTPTFSSLWQQFENVRRTLMTSHFGTAFANIGGALTRVGLDTIENAIHPIMHGAVNQARAAVGKPPLPDIGLRPTAGLDVVMRLLQSPDTAKKVEQVLESFPGVGHRLHNMHIEGQLAPEAGAVGAISQGLYKAQQGADVINSLNRFQEYTFRNAVFAARLDARLKMRGLNFDDVVKNNMTSAVSGDDLQWATKEALDMTFAKQYANGTASGHFISFVNKSGLTTLMPFPRFFINAMDYTISRSPLGILKFATQAERARIAAGDTRLISQMATGSAMFYTAYELLNAGAVVEQGRRLMLPDGRSIDLQRYNPYAAYFVIADLAKRKQEGRLHNVDIQKLAKSLGPDWRAGTGMAALDGALDSILGTAAGDKGKGLSGFKSVTGEYTGSFLTPLGNFVDAIDQYKVWKGSQVPEKDTRGSFAGPVLRNVPFAKDTLPNRELPTGPAMRESPGARLFSASVQKKLSPFERWMADNQGKSLNNMLPGSGVPDWDRSVAKAAKMTGFRQKLDAVVSSPEFKRMKHPEQVEKVREMVGEARKEAAELAEDLNPKAHEAYEKHRLTPEQHAIIQRRYGRVSRETIKMFKESKGE